MPLLPSFLFRPFFRRLASVFQRLARCRVLAGFRLRHGPANGGVSQSVAVKTQHQHRLASKRWRRKASKTTAHYDPPGISHTDKPNKTKPNLWPSKTEAVKTRLRDSFRLCHRGWLPSFSLAPRLVSSAIGDEKRAKKKTRPAGETRCQKLGTTR